MENLERRTSGQNAVLVIFAFLQTDSNTRNVEYSTELISLSKYIAQDTNCNGPWINAGEDGDLETDGHLASANIVSQVDDLLPSVGLQRHHEAEALQQVAEGLREIAAQLEHNIVAQATQNLRRNLIASPVTQWKSYLAKEVEKLMKFCVGLEQLPQERVIMALTLTLVKGVCEHTPRLLRNLFYTALQYITSSSWAR
ncbi:BH3 interacting domain death agonist [Channa argus]|uniref:BH3 interacting domain death agonist n=1 Tax=Channa argus TaxID=215402 RepID=UPI002946E48D|nr:hypothetical protein Q8A73_004867 [Channa argus]